MKRGSTVFLRGVVIFIGLIVLALCVFVVPVAIRSDVYGLYRPVLFGLYVTAVPFFIALFQALQLLHFIDEGKAFSDLSVTALKTIKNSAVIIGGLFAAGLPYVYIVRDNGNAPGVTVLGVVIIFASLVIAVFAAVLQRVLRDAIAIKSENDLTV